MDWKLEGSPQKTESHVLQEQEVLREDTGEYGMSESFQLLQIDVECERQEGETLPTGGAVLCSVSAASCLVTGFEVMGYPRDPVLRVDTGHKKTGNEFGVFQGANFLLTGLKFQFHLSHRKSN